MADVLNILQGVYIFIIFVCKRKVLNVILWKKGIHKDLDGTTDDESVVSQRMAENLEMDSVHAMDKVRASIVFHYTIFNRVKFKYSYSSN